MKKIFTILTLLTVTNIFATDRFVDPNLSIGNGTTLFTTITSAVNAAINGDRIIIASTTYNEPALTISKSLQIMPQTPGTIINFNANIIISGFAGMKLEITGLNLGIYSFISNSIASGSYTNRAKISIIDINCTNVMFSNDYYELNLLKSSLAGDLNFRYGNIVFNTMNNCYLLDESLSGQNTIEKNLIVGNNILNETQLLNDDFKFVFANNTLKNLRVQKWILNTSISNLILNNEFLPNCQLHFAVIMENPPSNNYNVWDIIYYVNNYNFIFSNNKFDGLVYFSNPNLGYSTFQEAFQNFRYGINFYASGGGAYIPIYSTSVSKWPNIYSSGFFEWSYNGVDIPSIQPSGSQPLSLNKIIGPVDPINGGNPNHNFYDIDLTINDRGVNGGPYSLLNYNPSNPNNSKAFIFDLDMPTDLFPGQNIDIKAKGYHKN